jgi:hypothetical protein
VQEIIIVWKNKQKRPKERKILLCGEEKRREKKKEEQRRNGEVQETRPVTNKRKEKKRKEKKRGSWSKSESHLLWSLDLECGRSTFYTSRSPHQQKEKIAGK